ncbi:MAG: AMIN domain-containing protein [Elusimicrobia bacterium]|nr:AMIN domain-containing protein [Elusimicrobiota bacterium]
MTPMMMNLRAVLRRVVALTAAAALLAPSPLLAQEAQKAVLEGVEAGSDKVAINLSRPTQFNAFTTAEPPRLVVELLDTEYEGPSQVLSGKGTFLDKVRAGQYQREPSPIARVVLYLKKMVTYRARWDGPRLDVELLAAADGSAKAAEAPASPVPAAKTPETVTDAPAAVAEKKPAANKLEAVETGPDSAAMRLTREARFVISTTEKPPRLIIEFDAVELGRGVPRAQAAKGAVLSRVRAVQFKPAPNPVTRVVLSLKSMAAYKARWDGPVLRLEVAGVSAAAQAAAAASQAAAAAKAEPEPEPKPAPKPAPKPIPVPVPAPVRAAPAAMAVTAEASEVSDAKLPKTMTTDASAELSRMAGVPKASPTRPAASAAAPASAGGPPASRQRRDILSNLPTDPITLEFDDMDIHDILALLAQKANINIVYGADVNGSLSLNLRDVPFNEAFLTVLSMRGLVASQSGENILRVMTPGSLTAERSVAVNRTRVIKLKYSKADKVAASVAAVAAAEGRKATFVIDENSNSIIITDTLDGIAAAERLLSELDIRPQQVLIEAKLVEVQLTKDLSLGIQWDYLSTDQSRMFGDQGRTMIGTTQNPAVAASPVLAPLDQNAAATVGVGAAAGGRGTGVFAPAARTVGAFTFGRVANNYFLSATLTAAASQGKAKVLSDPKVTTLNGKKAKIDITTTIPFVTTEITPSAGVQTISQRVLEQKTGITLEVTPTVNADGRITVEIKPSVKQPSAIAAAAGTTGAISVDTREADTTVIVQDGGTVVIGGLITDSVQERVSKVPLLGDIPIIGYLFRNKFVDRKRVELLIFVTTKIVPS